MFARGELSPPKGLLILIKELSSQALLHGAIDYKFTLETAPQFMGTFQFMRVLMGIAPAIWSYSATYFWVD